MLITMEMMMTKATMRIITAMMKRLRIMPSWWNRSWAITAATRKTGMMTQTILELITTVAMAAPLQIKTINKVKKNLKTMNN